MKLSEEIPHWYVDVRTVASTEQMSLDLTRHLPRRLAAGPAIIVSDRPGVLLSVVRKRWIKVIREVTLQHASTLNAQKKASLSQELEHLRQCQFTIKTFKQSPSSDCFFVSPTQLSETMPPCYRTLYLTTWLSAEDIQAAVRNLPLQGLIVAYGEWLPGYEKILRQTFQDRFTHYGRGDYPELPRT